MSKDIRVVVTCQNILAGEKFLIIIVAVIVIIIKLV